MQRYTVLIADGQEPTRAEIRSLVNREADLVIVGEVGTGEEAIREARTLRPDIVVMDVILPGMNGIEAADAITAETPATRILAVSHHAGKGLVRALLRAGGLGYICKAHLFEELLPAMRAVQAGERYLGRDTEA